MYRLVIWDKDLARIGQTGEMGKFEIPMELARLFFNLDSRKFPKLSSLSFDDYDLFSGTQLELLIHELLDFVSLNPSSVESINSMVKVISEAKFLGKSILFDPFSPHRSG